VTEGEDLPPTNLIAESGVLDDPGYLPSPHLDRIYAEVKERLALQRTELDDLQRIIAIVLTANGVVLGFAGSQFPIGPHHVRFFLLVAAVIVLAVDIVAGAWALWPKRAIKTTVDPATLVEEYSAAATNVMLYDLIAAARTAYEQNEDIGIRRLRSCWSVHNSRFSVWELCSWAQAS
jgi:hypothetical protein